MDLSMAEKLEKLSAWRLRTKISSIQSQASESSTVRISDVAPSAAPSLVPTNIKRDKSLPTSDPQNPMEDAKVESVDSTMDIANVVAGLAVKTTTKVVPAISPVRTIVEMVKNLPERII